MKKIIFTTLFFIVSSFAGSMLNLFWYEHSNVTSMLLIIQFSAQVFTCFVIFLFSLSLLNKYILDFEHFVSTSCLLYLNFIIAIVFISLSLLLYILMVRNAAYPVYYILDKTAIFVIFSSQFLGAAIGAFIFRKSRLKHIS